MIWSKSWFLQSEISYASNLRVDNINSDEGTGSSEKGSGEYQWQLFYPHPALLGQLCNCAWIKQIDHLFFSKCPLRGRKHARLLGSTSFALFEWESLSFATPWLLGMPSQLSCCCWYHPFRLCAPHQANDKPQPDVSEVAERTISQYRMYKVG